MMKFRLFIVALSGSLVAACSGHGREEHAGPPVGVSWDLLQQAKVVTPNEGGSGKGPGELQVAFGKEVAKLHGKQVKLEGFMLPVTQGDKHDHFLLSAYPPSCPFCLPGDAKSIIEVTCKQLVQYRDDVLIVSGKLSVLSHDPSGFYYRLSDATEVRH
jgi:uncharacterized protein